MDKKIKESYDKVQMSQDARERIYTQIMDSEEEAGRWSAEGRRRENLHGRNVLSRWKVSMAACLGLALVIPTGVYAAGKISEYFTVNIGRDKYQAKISVTENKTSEGKVSKKPEKYIQVKADFGGDYKFIDNSIDYYVDENGNVKTEKCKIEEGQDGMYSYSHKNGFDAGKDFYYDVIYMDESKDAILKLYDKAYMKEITVKGHKALLCESNTVQGSRYVSDHDTDYTIDLYVFYEEYGYVINFGGMQGLGKERVISLAESISVTEAAKDHASRYEYLSRLQKADMNQNQEEKKKKEITVPVKGVNQQIAYYGLSCQVTDVKISSKVKDTDIEKFNSDFFSKKTGLWDEKGKLKSYIRENIKAGDGVSHPERAVTVTEKVQPKMVYVTMKVKAKRDASFQLPEVNFLEREGKKYYNNGNQLYWQYNRPEKIEDALIDFMPCYFKETVGGKGFWLKEMKKGEEKIYHFAYMVDEDMVDHMVLNFGYNKQYVDIMK